MGQEINHEAGNQPNSGRTAKIVAVYQQAYSSLSKDWKSGSLATFISLVHDYFKCINIESSAKWKWKDLNNLQHINLSSLRLKNYFFIYNFFFPLSSKSSLCHGIVKKTPNPFLRGKRDIQVFKYILAILSFSKI